MLRSRTSRASARRPSVRLRLLPRLVLEAAGYPVGLLSDAGRRAQRPARPERGVRPLGRPLIGLALPFEGLPVAVRLLFWLAFVLIVLGLVWTAALFVARAARLQSLPPRPTTVADPLLWVFLVPALNEEMTIADSVERLARGRGRATRRSS